MNKRAGYVVTTGIIPAHSELELKFLTRFTVDGMTFDLQTGRVSILHIPRFASGERTRARTMGTASGRTRRAC